MADAAPLTCRVELTIKPDGCVDFQIGGSFGVTTAVVIDALQRVLDTLALTTAPVPEGVH